MLEGRDVSWHLVLYVRFDDKWQVAKQERVREDRLMTRVNGTATPSFCMV